MSELPFTLPQLLKSLVDQDGSDLHLSAGSPPRLRVHGRLLPLDIPSLTPKQTKDLCYSVLTENQKTKFELSLELDFAFSVKEVARFRANLYQQKGAVSAAFRVIPNEIKALQSLGLPDVVEKLCYLPRGLILICGPTGSGKSTSLAAMLDQINTKRQGHIVTVEDPIEYVHQHKGCVINQREVGSDTKSFAAAIKSALRQDPDVVLLGELRDLETISMAMTTAETGHLVLATLHTNNCISSITRIIDAFPPHQQAQIRTQLSFSLQAVVTQVLIPTNDMGRALCTEILIPNTAIRAMIRDGKVHSIYSAMQTGQDESGMHTMNQSLLDLVKRRRISIDQALEITSDKGEMEDLMIKNFPSYKPKNL